MLFSLAAFERSERPETRKVLLSAVGRARQSGVQAVLHENGDAGQESELLTRSGRTLRVRLDQHTLSGWHPTLAGEARIVFQGILGEV